MLKSSLCDYSDTYFFVKGNTAVDNIAAADANANNTNKKVFSIHCSIHYLYKGNK